MKTTRARRAPNWQDWLKSPGVCQQSLRYFERHAQIRRLNAQQAEADILGHIRKAFHNLRLANQIFDSNQKNQLQVSYSGENYYDWVITVSYYSMYQACLSALAAVRKSSENHSATVCALVYHYVHKRKQLNEQYLLSLDKIQALADQDVQKLVEKRHQREKASYDTGYTTQIGLAQTAISEARDFVLKLREILEDALGKDLMKGI